MSDLTEAQAPRKFFRDFIRLTGPYWTQPGRWKPRVMVGLLALLVVLQVALAIRLNIWSADLFDALERRSTEHATAQIFVFLAILLGIMVTNMGHLVVKRHLQLDWRRWLTRRVIGEWMEDARHYQAGLIPGDHANPDGRVAEDVRVLTEAAVDLASTFFYCVLLLVTFVGILWSLSGWIRVAGLDLPGHLVLLALIYAGIGAVVAFILGRPLVSATDSRQTKEADFRFELVRARECGEAIAIARAEAPERDKLASRFETIALAWKAQSVGLARLIAFSSGYAALAAVFPILVGTPRFLDGTLTLGRLMQSAQAFQQVTAALSWPVDNLPRIAEWRASVERVLALEEAVQIVALEAARTGDTAIDLDRAPGPWLGFDDLWVADPDGTAMLSGFDLRVQRGEHVLIDGDPEAAATLFRVLAGIWPWGRGHIYLPVDAEMVAVGRRAFLAEGTLRHALALPSPAVADHLIVQALEEVGLGRLVERLDTEGDWVDALSGAEQQRLSFARLLLLRPQWILLGEATDALDAEAADAMLTLITKALPDAAIVMIGQHPGSLEPFDRRLTLHRATSGEVLLNAVSARRRAARAARRPALPVVDWLRKGYGGND
ncbi:SbmA/BacA-like family transporter [Sediminicoccus sp. KRV36]|uniref:ABC transporter ATP-binding protein/permease n=1 Tax=Sediminicoccus sp. KRV36 TaxID=3133721 RepID=UPI00200C2C88|nr:SbmA/BacA-like family transporter [Sediminicoccus rosea]UPY38546.1 ABC transporter ATP-binding protein/permease [Sediminicoccus rosea]